MILATSPVALYKDLRYEGEKNHVRVFFLSPFNKSILLKSTYPLTMHVGRKEMRREWEKKSKRRELGGNK